GGFLFKCEGDFGFFLCTFAVIVGQPSGAVADVVGAFFIGEAHLVRGLHQIIHDIAGNGMDDFSGGGVSFVGVLEILRLDQGVNAVHLKAVDEIKAFGAVIVFILKKSDFVFWL